jgi:hypothetical protein
MRIGKNVADRVKKRIKNRAGVRMRVARGDEKRGNCILKKRGRR